MSSQRSVTAVPKQIQASKPTVTIIAVLPSSKSAVSQSLTSGSKSTDLSLATVSDPKAVSTINEVNKQKQTFDCTLSTIVRNTPTTSSTIGISTLTVHGVKNRSEKKQAGGDDLSSALIGQFVSVDPKTVPAHVKGKLVKAIYGKKSDKIDDSARYFEGLTPSATGSYLDAANGPAWAVVFPDKVGTNSALVAYRAGEA